MVNPKIESAIAIPTVFLCLLPYIRFTVRFVALKSPVAPHMIVTVDIMPVTLWASKSGMIAESRKLYETGKYIPFTIESCLQITSISTKLVAINAISDMKGTRDSIV